MDSIRANKQTSRPDLSRVMALAHEIHGLLAACREFLPETTTTTWGRLSPSATATLGASSLDDLFQSKSVFRAGGTPETIGRAVQVIQEHLVGLRRDIKALTAEKLRLEAHLHRVEMAKQEIVGGLGQAKARVAVLRREHSVHAADHGRLLAEKRPVLKELRRQSQEHAAYLRPSGQTGSRVPVTAAENHALDQRRGQYRVVRDRLESLKAELGVSRAELAVKAADLARAASELDRDKALAAARWRLEEKNRLELEQVESRLVESRQGVLKSKRLLKDMSRIHRIWPELQKALSCWPEHCRNLARLAEKSASPGDLPSPEEIGRVDWQLVGSVRAWQELMEQLEELQSEGRTLGSDYYQFESDLLSFSRSIDRKAADYDHIVESPIQELKSLVEQSRRFKREYQTLTDRRDDIRTRLSRVGESLESVNRAWLDQVARRKVLVDEYVAAVRGRAIRRGVLVHQERRLHEQLSAVHAGLPGLIGPSAFLEGCLISGVLALSGTRQTLDKWKASLARAHDSLASPPLQAEAIQPTSASVLAGLWEDVGELERLDKVAEVINRLPRQLSAYRAALVRGHRMANLRDAYQRRGEKMVRLDRDRKRLLELVRNSRKQLTFMTQERERLAAELTGVRRRADRVTDHVRDELYPLVRTLGLALYQGQVRTADLLKREEAKDAQLSALSALAAELEMGKEKAEGVVVQLGTLLGAQGRDLERQAEAWRHQYQESLDEARTAAEKAEAMSRRVKEVEAAYRVKVAKHKKQLADLNIRLTEMEAEKRDEQRVARQLSLALVQLGEEGRRREKAHELRRNRLFAAAKVWEGRARNLNLRTQELEATYLDSLNLIRRQSHDLQTRADRLAELYPLLSFFMERLEVWTRPDQAQQEQVVQLPQGSEYLVVFLHLLRQENEALRDAVTVLKQDRQSLVFENEHLAQSQQAIKARLEELLPVFTYYWQAWLATTARLAESESGQLSLTEQLTGL